MLTRVLVKYRGKLWEVGSEFIYVFIYTIENIIWLKRKCGFLFCKSYVLIEYIPTVLSQLRIFFTYIDYKNKKLKQVEIILKVVLIYFIWNKTIFYSYFNKCNYTLYYMKVYNKYSWTHNIIDSSLVFNKIVRLLHYL